MRQCVLDLGQKVYDKQKEHISGLVASALSLRIAGQMGFLRTAARNVIRRKLHLVSTVVLDKRAADFRHLVLGAANRRTAVILGIREKFKKKFDEHLQIQKNVNGNTKQF